MAAASPHVGDEAVIGGNFVEIPTSEMGVTGHQAYHLRMHRAVDNLGRRRIIESSTVNQAAALDISDPGAEVVGT